MAEASKKMQIVFASAECAPFVKTGGLGDVAGSLPAALTRAGAEVIVMVPKYATIKEEYKRQMTHLTDFYVSLGWRNEYCGLEKLEHDGVTYIFIDNERYFARDYPYGFFDDGERFAFFSKAVTDSLQHLPDGFECDILHCNDWQTALAPVFLREFYQGLPLYDRVKTIFSIHNVAFQGQFSDKVMEDILGLAHIPAAATQLRCDRDSINYMMGALHYADAITTVSPTYAAEIQTPEYGEGLDGVLRDRSYALQGILNGIDTRAFDPATDKRIAANYTVDDMSGKAVCKAKLQEELGLEVRDDRPLMVMVTRLTRQKGLDLVMYALDRILSGGIQVAVLGTGDRDYEDGLRYFQDKYPGTMAARIEFDPALSQRMYAGADMFLMPSLFEPCGLSQIIAMRYGTLPVVRETGGLKDTVVPYNQFTGAGTGFSFSNFNGDEMGDTVFRAARLFWDNHDEWNKLIHQAMDQDFSWTRSADRYLDLYFFLHPEIQRPRIESESEKPSADTATGSAVENEAKPETPTATESNDKPKPKPEPEPKAETDTPKEEAPKPEAQSEKKPAAKTPAKKTAAKSATRKTVKPKTTKSTATNAATSNTAADTSTTEKVSTAKAAATKKTGTKSATATRATPKSTTKAKTTAASTDKASETATIKPKAAAAETPSSATESSKPAVKKATTRKTATKKTATKAAAAKSTATKASSTKSAASKATGTKAGADKTEAEKATTATTSTVKRTASKTTTKRTPAKKTTATTTVKTESADAKTTAVEKENAAVKPAVSASEATATSKTEKAEAPAAKSTAKSEPKMKSVRKATSTRKRR